MSCSYLISAPRQLQSIARQLAVNRLEWMRQRRAGSAVKGSGSAVAAGAAIIGMFAAGPAFLATIVVGTVVALGGQVTDILRSSIDASAVGTAQRGGSKHANSETKLTLYILHYKK